MSMYIFGLFFDAGIGAAGEIGVFAAIVFFLIFLAVAFVAFKLLKRSVKMAFRMAIVAIIIAVAIAGSFALYMFSTAKTPRPTPVRPR